MKQHLLNCLLPSVLALTLVAGLAVAGPNAGGTLIVHGDQSVIYTTDTEDYTGDAPLPGGCESAVTNYPADATFVWWVKAAFPDGASPRLSGVTFGIDYDEAAVLLVASGPCGDFELSDSEWPASQSGTAVTFQNAQTATLVDIYWFAGYNYSYYGADVSFDLIGNPSQGAFFADDDVPSTLDPIEGLGSLGFGNDPGSLPCPAGAPAEGACCFDDGSCQVLSQDECGSFGGAYEGDDTVCDPNPCVGVPPLGACCFPDGNCTIETEAACSGAGGDYQGDDTVCDPNPCDDEPQIGACCSDAGSCSFATQEDCEAAGSFYLGDGVDCSPDPCMKPGACCFGEACQFLSPYDCEDLQGVFQGEETSCDPNPCRPATGACCFPDGSCQFLNESDCDGSQGTYQGDDTVCDPNPCPPPPTGACCFDDESCQVLTVEECETAGGNYLGDDLSCEPNPCVVTPTLDSSWGRIKDLYR